MTVERQIYDPETAIPAAIAPILAAAELTTKIVSDPPQLRSARSRCEVTMQQGPHSQEMLLGESGLEATPGTLRETAWEGQVFIDVISDASTQELHFAYRAKIRNLCATMKRRVNGITLDLLWLNWFESAGSTYEYAPEKGYFKSTLQFKIQYSVLTNAWALLASEQNP